jgi:AraC-like DNA-binding protein
MKAVGNKKYTARELAEQFGCSVKTIHNHANKLFGVGVNGIVRKFDEAQTTLILESIKGVKSQNDTLKVDLQGTETTMSLDLQIALAERAEKEAAQRSRDLWKRKALEQEIRAMRAEALLQEREAGLEMYQRIAESAGLVMSDRDDIENTYRRRMV